MKSLLKTLDIIEAVAEAGSAGIHEISAMTGFPPSTIHRIVTTLVERHYLKQDKENKKYSLSFRFLELGTKAEQQFQINAIARPHLERLVAETKESANLAVKDGDNMVYLDQVQSDHSMLRLFTRPNARVPLYSTGVGKMFLSQMNESDLDKYLQRTRRIRHTPYTLITREEIREELALIRAQGFSVDNEEMEEGVRCVATLIFDHNGQPIAAVSISGAAIRITPKRVAPLGKLIKTCASAISGELGFNPTY